MKADQSVTFFKGVIGNLAGCLANSNGEKWF